MFRLLRNLFALRRRTDSCCLDFKEFMCALDSFEGDAGNLELVLNGKKEELKEVPVEDIRGRLEGLLCPGESSYVDIKSEEYGGFGNVAYYYDIKYGDLVSQFAQEKKTLRTAPYRFATVEIVIFNF